MSKFNKFSRGFLLVLPIIAITVFVVCESMAASIISTTPGQISSTTTQGMSNYTAYPSGVNPLSAASVPPLIMLVMSRDEQLFNKAYPDYTDLNGDGNIDTTYLDSFSYNGYFDPNICYQYASSQFVGKIAVNSGGHACPTGNQYWSGNFLNWVAMSRLDVLRWTFYGGTRSTDTATSTVLERAEIPDDLHAWAKVYSGSDIASFAPFTATTTFCNVSTGTTGGFGTPSQSASGIKSTPVIRTASGAWGDWASTALLQCQNFSAAGDGRPTGTITNYTARVQVCQNVAGVPNESFCVADGSALKPEGLLQQYSKNNSSIKRFGLVTGSAVNARIGGQLRRNVGQLANNPNNTSGTGCNPGSGAGDGDEFSSVDGTFCYKTTAATEGIVKTIDRLQVTGWNGSDYGDSYNTAGDTTCHGISNPWGARGYSIQATPTMCPDFGNPLAGMYAQALRYIQGNSPSNQDTSGNLPNPTWVDPYGTASGATSPRNQPCASCSIVLVSSGLNSFDSTNVPSVTNLNPTSLTNSLQSAEGISGQYVLSTYYNTSSLTGAPANGTLTTANTTFSDIAVCAPATIGNLSNISGICNGTPGQQGSYAIAGLSYGAWTTPIRTDGKVVSGFQVKTYGVSLSDNLPSFNIATGVTGASLSISPSCRADPASAGTYTSCYIGSVRIGAQQTYNTTTATGFNTYGLVPTANYPNVGSYYFVWEDSQYGSDHDQDANALISYCIGASCNLPSTVTSGVAICDPVVLNNAKSSKGPVYGGACNSAGQLTFTPGANDVVIRNQITGYSSNGMSLGYLVSGTTSDGLVEFRITNGGTASSVDSSNGAIFNCNLLGNVDCNSSPQVKRFTLSNSAAVPTLQTPLWYAAKYSGYNGTAPSLLAGQDPPNYFFARNAGALKAQLNTVFQSITSSPANDFGNATTPSSSNDVAGNGLSYQVSYYQQRNSVNWTGGLQAFWSDTSGFLREGTVANGNQVLSSTANYLVTGPDKSTGALANALTTYRCAYTVTGIGTSGFDPSVTSGCSAISATNMPVPAWDGTASLNAYYDTTTTAGASASSLFATQRAYSSDPSASGSTGQRYIFTYLTQSPNGVTAAANLAPNSKAANTNSTVTNGTQTDFVWTGTPNVVSGGSICPGANSLTNTYVLTSTSGFCGDVGLLGLGVSQYRRGNFGLLNEMSPSMAQNLVNWIRGVEDPTDYRSRTASTLTNTYRLGDIVDSSPSIVATPAESYDLLYGDNSYGAFRSNYRNRRQMVYVGANDGMLHAFSSGFYVPAQTTPTVAPPTIYKQLPTGLVTGDLTTAQGNNWALGQEAWAFIPDNLLPHLRWLADKGYTHVFYVDGAPVVSDVQIFGSSTSTSCQAGTPTQSLTSKGGDIDSKGHVCGWGTVMVVPFRLGGGPIQVDTVGDGGASNNQSSNSAYVILDVTDPEIPPTVLGEITTGSFALGAPAFSVHRESDGKLHFLLTIGSGPGDNGGPGKSVSATASSNLSVQVYDLANIFSSAGTTASSTPVAALTGTTSSANSFASDMIASDFDLNYSAEAVYFGIVTNPPVATGSTTPPQIYGGGLWKVDMNTGAAASKDTSDPSTFALKQVFNAGQPVTIRPTVAIDSASRKMVYFGTGRSYTTDDDSGTSAQGTQQQYIYGISDNSLLSNLAAACQTLPVTGPIFDASNTLVSSSGTLSLASSTGTALPTGVQNLSDLEAALTSIVPATPTPKSPLIAGCYAYSGWSIKLQWDATGVKDATPSERVVSSQTLFNSVLLTPTYLPPSAAQIAAAGSSTCNPIPVPGTSYLYGLDYLTGTGSLALSSSFGVNSSGNVNSSVSLGAGKASSPVLHVGSNGSVTAAFGLGGNTVLKNISSGNPLSSGETSWREPVDKQ